MLQLIKSQSMPSAAPPAQTMQRKNFNYGSFAASLAYSGWMNLASYMSMQYYMQVAPLANAIDTITAECQSIGLFVQDKETGALESDHPILTLLNKPNAMVSSHYFFEQLFSYYLITGNVYVVVTGITGPRELSIISPEFISITNGKDGYPQDFRYASSAENMTFSRKEVDGRFRFYSNNGMQEIYQIKRFNPVRGTGSNYGLSPLSSIYFEVEQYIKSGLHNLALLTQGGRPSGMVTTKPEETLSDEEFKRLEEQITRFYTGPENAGKVLFMDNNMTYTEMGQTNKDMDYAVLKKQLVETIYNRYKIPLALISTESMTYNNLESAKLLLYDLAVLPLLTRILDELTIFLMPRYGKDDAKKYELAYDKDSIPALVLRRNEELTLRKNIGVNSINEIRAMQGNDPAIGGDDIYSSAGTLPIARVTREDERAEADTEFEEDDEKAQKQDYLISLKRRRDKKGQPLYSDVELTEFAKQWGIADV